MTSFHRFSYAARGLSKNFEFAFTSVLTLGLGIGITPTIFSVIYGVLLKATSFAHATNCLCVLANNRFQPSTSIGPERRIHLIWTGRATTIAYEDVGVMITLHGAFPTHRQTPCGGPG